MNAQHFIECVKVQRFCLILLGESGLWYHSCELINVNRQGLHKFIQAIVLKWGDTREELFHAWRSFSFDENTETIDAYIVHISQVATLLGYGEPQILEVFKNTLSTKLHWTLFPIGDLKQAVETAKRILTNEKIDSQLSGQSSSTPFMSIKDNDHRRITFDTENELGDKIYKLTVMMEN